MNTIPSTQERNPNIELSLSETIQELLHLNEHELNVAEGSEFLDDAIRTKDQPFGERTAKENY
jgi:hypothetical protein